VPSVCFFSQVVYEAVAAVLVAFVAGEYQPALKSLYLMNTINTMNRLDMCEFKFYLCPSVCLFSQVVYEGVAAVLVIFVAGEYQPALKSL